MRYWYNYPELLDRAKLSEMIKSERFMTNIARKIGCSPLSVKKAVSAHGLDIMVLRLAGKRK